MRSLEPDSSPVSENRAAPARKPANFQKLRQQRDRLYEEARDNPDSDASEMVRALLLSGILSAEAEARDLGKEDEALRRSLSEERRQQRLAGGRAAEEAGAEFLSGRAGASRAERRLREVETMLEEVAEVAAKAAAQPAMDPMAVYRRIAEIVGLQSPAEQAGPAGDIRREGTDDGFPPPRE
jgi:hypothetical protein